MAKNTFDEKELVQKATEGTYFSPDASKMFLDEATEVALPAALVEHGYVHLHHFGSFERVLVPERTYPNPQKKGETVTKPAHWRVRFRAFRKFRDAIQ